MNITRFFLSFILITALSLPIAAARAQTQDPLLSLPEGQVILSISATERKEVAQNLLVGTLSYVVTNRDAGVVQNDINTVMARAVEIAKKQDKVKISTGAYQVYETTVQRTEERVWRGEQSLTLKSGDTKALLDLAGELQKLGLTMNGLSYTLDPETAVKVQDSLMESALKQLQERANRAAAALGKSGADLRDVSVQSDNMPYPRPYMPRAAKMETMAMDMAAPVAEAGETTITLTVSARAILKP